MRLGLVQSKEHRKNLNQFQNEPRSYNRK
jgi:hypothetical protein